MIRQIFFISFLILSLVITVSGQQITGNIEGRILDNEGKPLPDVNIIVNSSNLQGTRGTTTGEGGYFRILSLPPGIYTLRIKHIAHNDVTLDSLIVSLGRTLSIGDIKLTAKTFKITGVMIRDKSPLIDPGTTSFGANLNSKEFELLPIGRNYREMTTLLPEANISYLGDEINISGGTGRENRYFIDGSDVTDPEEGSIESNLPYNFIKEVRLTDGGYEAEYRGSLGGLVNVITYSGSNELHGSVFGFYTGDWLASTPKLGLLDPAQGSYSDYDFGLGIGGAIIRDKLWFYAAYNPTFSRREVILPGLNQTSIDKSVTHAFALKLTWKASSRLNIVFTSTGDPKYGDAVGSLIRVFGEPPTRLENPDPYLSSIQSGGVNLSLSGTYTLGSHWILDASVSAIRRTEINKPSTDRGWNEVLFVDTGPGVWSGGFSYDASPLERIATGGKLSATVSAGDHLLKTGIGYRDNGLNANLVYSALLGFPDTTFLYFKGGTIGNLHNRILSAFVQDSWQIDRGLRINGGIRWEGQSLVAWNGNVVQKINSPLQPRIGFVFIPDVEGKNKIYGSFGRFSQPVQTGILGSYYSKYPFETDIDYLGDPRTGTPGEDTLYLGGYADKITHGQYYDEFSLGYERMISQGTKIGVKGIYRTLRETIEDGWIESEQRYYLGNPGYGILSDFPKAQRDYTALVITFEHHGNRFSFQTSYILSRNYGNYPGLFDYIYTFAVPNTSGQFDDIESLKNGRGLLPNDRTHVFKFLGSYDVGFGLIIGTTFTWLSGTPLSEMARYENRRPYFLSQRGTAGRTPSIWDLNARLVYNLPLENLPNTRLILDIFHIASQGKPVQYIEEKYFNVDQNGMGILPNANYGQPFAYQPVMSIRVGIETNF